ncbi:MAG: hypothetical protein Kilf2KO_44540 [Rhodospirillales bacterium]
MAYIDANLLFSEEQAETTTATHNSDNVVDLSTTADFGSGEPLYLVVRCTESVTSAGAASVTVQLVSDNTASSATNGTQSVHLRSDAIPKASLTAGATVFQAPLPSDAAVPYERYLAVQYVIASAALTAGKFTAYIAKDAGAYSHYPNAI